MKKQLFNGGKLFVLGCVCVSIANVAFAADVESAQQLDEMTVKADKSAVPANPPVTAEGEPAKQIAESVQKFDEMVIKADKPAVPANLPATSEGVTAKQIDESINAVTAAATIKYMPSIVVRERYIGDRNSVV
jgi:hypothetical protein